MDADPNTLGAAPWYTSTVQKAQLVSFLTTLIGLVPQITAKFHITPADVSNGVTIIFGLAAGAAALYGMVKRAASPIQPLTLNQSKADDHPATLVADTRNNPPTGV